MSDRLEIVCPCCKAVLTVDAATGTVIFHAPAKAAVPKADIPDLKGDLERRKAERERAFEKEMSAVKDRSRLLDEKFREALKDAERRKDEPPPRRDIDLE
ncbi:MAG: 2-nitropropane dioxygenase [Acidobacteriota bacterium]